METAMNKQEAIQKMSEGHKVTHKWFGDDEWMTIENGKLLLEDGVICSMSEFWLWRRDDSWDDGYSLFEAVEVSTTNKDYEPIAIFTDVETYNYLQAVADMYSVVMNKVDDEEVQLIGKYKNVKLFIQKEYDSKFDFSELEK